MAGFPTRTQWRSIVYGELPAAQRMSRLCGCGGCHLHLEFRCGRKVSWDSISRDARPAAAVEGRAPLQTTRYSSRHIIVIKAATSESASHDERSMARSALTG